MKIMSAEMCMGRRWKGESTLLDDEDRETFTEKENFE